MISTSKLLMYVVMVSIDSYDSRCSTLSRLAESASEEHFSQYVLSMNKHLKPLGLEVGGARMEDCDEVWYAIVNRLPDAAAKVGSKFSPQELELFNKLV